MIKAVISSGISVAILLGISAAPSSASEPCRGYGNNSDEEFNNCSFITGRFQSADHPHERITVWLTEDVLREHEFRNYYQYEVAKGNIQPLQLWDLVIQGTQDRPEYWFRNGKVFHVVIFRPSDPNVIRLKILEFDRVLSNQLLYRVSD